MFWRREPIAEQHLRDCVEYRRQQAEVLREMRDDQRKLEERQTERHEENLRNFDRISAENRRLERKYLWGLIGVLLTVLGYIASNVFHFSFMVERVHG